MLVLYHHPMSAAARLARLVLAEYDDTAEFVEELLYSVGTEDHPASD